MAEPLLSISAEGYSSDIEVFLGGLAQSIKLETAERQSTSDYL